MTRSPDGGAEQGCGEAAAGAAPEEGDKGGGQRIAEQIAAGGTEEMGEAAGEEWAGGKNRQADCAFEQVGAERGTRPCAATSNRPSSRTAKGASVSGTGVK